MQYGQFAGTGSLPEKTSEREDFCYAAYNCKRNIQNRETFLDKEITVGGWVRSVRDSKTFGFIVLHDGTFFETLQVVYHDSMENFAEISRLNVGAAIIVKGTLVATPQAKTASLRSRQLRSA